MQQWFHFALFLSYEIIRTAVNNRQVLCYACKVADIFV
jgi:hypothetical protein